jgi:hypothetical protein
MEKGLAQTRLFAAIKSQPITVEKEEVAKKKFAETFAQS